MGLLNPILLMLGAAAAVPLLLHLFQRHQGPRVVFPALRYLLRAEKESARRVRLRQILLMLLRIAAVLLLALAAARPFVRAGGVGHSPTAVVIVLDNSMSTSAVDGETRVLDKLKARALTVLDNATPDDRFWLLRAGQPGEPALAGDAEQTALRIRETEPTAAAADITGALSHAAALLGSAADGRATEIHLLTDMQQTSFGSPADRANAPPVIVWYPEAAPPENRAVASVEVGGGLAPVADQRSTVAAGISGEGSAEVNVRLSVDDRLVAAAAAAPGATAVLALPARAPGLVYGRVELDADALRADDVRYFASRVMPPPSVSVSGDLPFVNDGLEVLAEAGRITRANGGADVAFLDAGIGLASQGTRGAVVILPPTAPVELAAVNRRLADAGIPWRYEPPVSGEARFAAAAGDPLMNALGNARLRQVYPLVSAGTPGAADTVLLRLADGGAWAVRGERGVGGIYVLLGSPLTPEASTLPTTAAMLPLMDRLTGAWARAQPPRTDAEPGAEIALAAGVTRVERPDGTMDDVAGSSTYRLGGDPGIYRLLNGDSVMAAYAVNPPAAESDLARLDEDGLEARLPNWPLHVTTSADDWEGAVFRERLGSELWRPLLFAALIVLLVETLVAAAGRAQRGAAATRTAEAESH